MAFFQLVLKARRLEKARLRYENEKLRSIEISKFGKAQFTLGQRLRRKKLLYQRKVKKFLSRTFAPLKRFWCYNKAIAIRTEGTLENYVAKSFFGFFGGVILTYIFFIFFVLQLGFRLSSATAICTIIGVILTMGLAFSPVVRCVVFLLLPQFFSKRGRQALMAYAFVLALTGPVKNTLHNTGVLSESLACAQEQLKEAVKTVVDLVKQPFYALRDAIARVMRTVKVIVKKIKQTLRAIKRLVLSILRVITSVFQWLGNVVNICNKKLGTPFERCQAVFDGAVSDCKAKLGPVIGVVCNLTYIVGALCYVVKPFDFICMLVSYIADSVVGAVKTKIRRFTMHMKAMFYVKVKFSHSFHFETNQSKTIEEVSTGIATEIRSKTDRLFGFFNLISVLTSLFVFIILLRVMRYRYKWLTSERFDNRYITEDLRTIDLVRARQNKETVLPLNPRERNRYASLSSILLIKSEKVKLARSAVFLGLTTIKLVAYMIIDYSLYWVLNTIQIHGRFQSKAEQPNVVTIHVSGDGYLSDLYKSIVKAFTPQGNAAEVNTMICLPDPVLPDLDKYTQICVLIIFCWLMAFFEPYGLRLRHVVLCRYYPDRAKQRAAWLYNHIIRSRGSFLKFVRRQLRRKFGTNEGEKIENVTLKDRLWAVCPFLNALFPRQQNMCLLCGAVERSDGNPHVKCSTPGCVGLFCTQCFADLQNLCTICRSPIEYGDLSDMSEEKDSSDDQIARIREREPSLKREESKVTREEEEEEEPESTQAEEEPETTQEEPESTREEEQRVEKIEEKKEEKKEEEVKEVIVKPMKDVTEQTEEKYVEDEQSSDSSYSYTYQDESPEEIETIRPREPFKDVEGQKIRDDVTIQIFNEPFIRDVSSCSGSPTSGFVLRARRNVRSRLKRKPSGRSRDSDSTSSISTARSWSTEDEEEVIHIEVDESEELLGRDRRDQAKRGRINKIVDAVARIPWLGKTEQSETRRDGGVRTKRPSLMDRIIGMLQRKRSMPVQTYKRSRKIKDSSSSSISQDDEENVLLRDDGYLAGGRCRTEDGSDESVIYSREKRFATKKLPRYLESTARGTCYYEVDEIEDSRATARCVRQVEEVNDTSDVNVMSDPRQRGTRKIAKADEYVDPCTCTSEMTMDTSRDTDSLEMVSASEHTEDTSRTETEDETDESGTEYTEKSTPKNERKRVRDTSKSREDFDTPSDDKKSKYSEETTEVSESEPDESAAKKVEEKIENRKENEPQESEAKEVEEKIQNREESEAQESEAKEVEEKIQNREESEPRETEAKIASKKDSTRRTENTSVPAKENTEKLLIERHTEVSPSLYDPYAGLEMYGVHYKPKMETVRKGIEFKESEVQKSEEVHAEVNESNKKVPEPRATELKVDKATDLPDKSRSTQTRYRKRDADKKMKRAGQEDIKVSSKKTSDKETKKKKRAEEKGDGSGRHNENELVKVKRKEHEVSHEKDDKKLRASKRKEKKRKTESQAKDEKRSGRFVSGFRSILHPEVSKKRSKRKERVPYRPDKYSQYGQESSENFDRSQEIIVSPSISDQRLCQCNPRDYDGAVSRRSFSELQDEIPGTYQAEISEPSFQMPVLKKYLPMYQKQELIEELKMHDRMKLIQESEARRRQVSASPRSPQRISPVVPCYPSTSRKLDKEDRLPYQETTAFRNVLREFQTRTSRKKCKDGVPLIRLSKRADKTKQVEELYPPRSRRKSDKMKKFAHKLVAPFKKQAKEKCEGNTRNLTLEEMHGTCDCMFDPDIVSSTSYSCLCSKYTLKSSTSASADETRYN